VQPRIGLNGSLCLALAFCVDCWLAVLYGIQRLGLL
jgi:hypothetical protein